MILTKQMQLAVTFSPMILNYLKDDIALQSVIYSRTKCIVITI